MLYAKNQMGTLILIFITIIVGIALINALGDQIWENTNIPTSDNETVDITSVRGIEGNFTYPVKAELSLANDDLASFTELRMENTTAATRDTDYIVNLTEGTITMLDTVFTAQYNGTENYTSVDYTYYEAAYVKHSIARMILNTLVLIFFVLGMVVWVYAAVTKEWLSDIGK